MEKLSQTHQCKDLDQGQYVLITAYSTIIVSVKIMPRNYSLITFEEGRRKSIKKLEGVAEHATEGRTQADILALTLFKKQKRKAHVCYK